MAWHNVKHSENTASASIPVQHSSDAASLQTTLGLLVAAVANVTIIC